jgi:hypothetical protein
MSADPGVDPPHPPADLRQMRRYYRQSRSALATFAAMGLLVTAVGIAIEIWGSGCSLWVWIAIMALAWFGFVGDLINVFDLRRRIARAERSINPR